jgi:hypothetical protein
MSCRDELNVDLLHLPRFRDDHLQQPMEIDLKVARRRHYSYTLRRTFLWNI